MLIYVKGNEMNTVRKNSAYPILLITSPKSSFPLGFSISLRLWSMITTALYGSYRISCLYRQHNHPTCSHRKTKHLDPSRCIPTNCTLLHPSHPSGLNNLFCSNRWKLWIQQPWRFNTNTNQWSTVTFLAVATCAILQLGIRRQQMAQNHRQR